MHEPAAIDTGGIVADRPFMDGNERTGFLIGILFLELNGCRYCVPEEQATRALVALAAGQSSVE